MKHYLLLFLLLLGATVTVSAQSAPPKRANVIIITTTDSAAVAWRNIGRALAAQGFAIKSSDKDLLTVTTEPLSVGGGGVVAVAALVKGGAIELRGSIAVPAIDNGTAPMEYRGMEGSTYMRAWRKLDSAAKAYPGGTVSYSRVQ